MKQTLYHAYPCVVLALLIRHHDSTMLHGGGERLLDQAQLEACTREGEPIGVSTGADGASGLSHGAVRLTTAMILGPMAERGVPLAIIEYVVTR